MRRENFRRSPIESRRMISAIVLAAGQGKRFGECKQLVRLGDQTVLEHVLEPLRASKIDEIVVVLGAHAGAIQAEVQFEGERVILNPDHASGMSSSIHAGLRALSEDVEAVMIVLGDQPFIQRETLDLLIDASWRHTEAAVVPVYNGLRGNP